MKWRGFALALLALPAGSALQAQAIRNEPPKRHFTESEITAIAMPALAFEESAENLVNYDKYFYFHRPDTSFEVAYADIVECDALSSGSSIYGGADSGTMASAMTTYGIGPGLVGGAIASAILDATVGAAERRKARRQNLRTCMFFKDYDRYGLAKRLWDDFNFEEGNTREEADKRTHDLLTQARVASGPRPQQQVLAP